MTFALVPELFYNACVAGNKKKMELEDFALIVKKGFDEVHGKFGEVNHKLNEVNHRLDEVNQTLKTKAGKDDLRQSEDRIKQRLDSLDRRLDTLATHEKRIVKLERVTGLAAVDN